MGKRYLLDTNVIIDFFSGKITHKQKEFLSEIIDNEINISVITKIELLSYSGDTTNFELFIDASNAIGLEDNVIKSTITIRKKHKTKLPDAVIAATAQQFGLIILTNNVSDFQNIKGVKVQNPHLI